MSRASKVFMQGARQLRWQNRLAAMKGDMMSRTTSQRTDKAPVGCAVDMSDDGHLIRVTVNGEQIVMTRGEWSKMISRPGSFRQARVA